MPARDLSEAEIIDILEQQRIVRIAFRGEDGPYVVPLGYVWHQGAICCIASEGRKTGLVRKDGRVSFQLDTSAETGTYSWKSVTGQGEARILSEETELARVFQLLMARFSAMPEWARAEFAVRRETQQYVVLKVTPIGMTGRAYEGPSG
jgi:nitroimidazol reductase NimA-like FMN-containing flavoprotein (pyridoxamine 5'-phosphate oxidase superfamily)